MDLTEGRCDAPSLIHRVPLSVSLVFFTLFSSPIDFNYLVVRVELRLQLSKHSFHEFFFSVLFDGLHSLFFRWFTYF